MQITKPQDITITIITILKTAILLCSAKLDKNCFLILSKNLVVSLRRQEFCLGSKEQGKEEEGQGTDWIFSHLSMACARPRETYSADLCSTHALGHH